MQNPFDKMLEWRRAVRKFDTEAEFDPAVVLKSLQRATLSANSSNLQLWEFYRIRTKELKEQFTPICLNQNAAKTSNEIIAFVARPDLWSTRAQFNVDKHLGMFHSKNSSNELNPKQQMIVNYWSKHIPFENRSWFGLYDLYKNLLVFFIGLKKPIKRHLNKKGNWVSAHKTVSLAAQTFMLSLANEGYDTCPMEGFDTNRAKKLLKLPKGADITMLIAVGKRAKNGVYGPRFRLDFEKVYYDV